MWRVKTAMFLAIASLAACASEKNSDSTFAASPPATTFADPTCTVTASLATGMRCSVARATCRPEGVCGSAVDCTCDGAAWSCVTLLCACPSTVSDGDMCLGFPSTCPRGAGRREECTCENAGWRCASADAGLDAGAQSDAASDG